MAAPLIALRWFVGLASLAGSTPVPPPHLSRPPVTAPAQQPAGRDQIAAQGMGATVSFAEYDELIMNRHARSERGRDALEHLLKSELLAQLAIESGLEVAEKDIDERMRALDAEIRSTGDLSGLEGQLREYRIERGTFRHFLRLQIIQEVLSRRALGIPGNNPVHAEQQEMWLNQQLDQRGKDFPAPPYEGADPVMARCGNLEVRKSAFVPHLRTQLDAATVRDDCYQLLLEKLIAARMPDLAPEALDREIAREIERRRAQHASDPQYEGVSFEQVMAARGLRLDRLGEDPAIVVASLTRLWVDRVHGEEGLRAAYEAERSAFDSTFGSAVPISVIFRNAVAVPNPLQNTTFEQAEAELRDLSKVINGLEAFGLAAKAHSEDKGTAEKGGALGYTTRGDERFPAELRELAFANQGAGLVGPVRLTQGVSGVALLWVGELRPSPGWEVMREHVHNELRRQLLDETLPMGGVVTWLDTEN